MTTKFKCEPGWALETSEKDGFYQWLWGLKHVFWDDPKQKQLYNSIILLSLKMCLNVVWIKITDLNDINLSNLRTVENKYANC